MLQLSSLDFQGFTGARLLDASRVCAIGGDYLCGSVRCWLGSATKSADWPIGNQAHLRACASGSKQRGFHDPVLPEYEKRAIRVHQRADCYNEIGRPKSISGERTVPAPPLVLNALREWRLQCPKGQLGLCIPNGAGHVETAEQHRSARLPADPDRRGRVARHRREGRQGKSDQASEVSRSPPLEALVCLMVHQPPRGWWPWPAGYFPPSVFTGAAPARPCRCVPSFAAGNPSISRVAPVTLHVPDTAAGSCFGVRQRSRG